MQAVGRYAVVLTSGNSGDTTVKARFLWCIDPPLSEQVANIHAPNPDISLLDASQLYGPLAGGIDLGKGKGIIVGECAAMVTESEDPAEGRCLTVGDNAYPADLLFRQEHPNTDTWFSFRFSPEVPDTQFIGVHTRYVSNNDRVMLRIHPNRVMIRNIHGGEYTYQKDYPFERGCWYDVRIKTYGITPEDGRMHVWIVRNATAQEVDWAAVDGAETPPILTTGVSPMDTTSSKYTFIRFGGEAAHTANSMQMRFFRQRAYPLGCAAQPPLLPVDFGGVLEVTPAAPQTVVTLAGESKQIIYAVKNTATGSGQRLDVSVSLPTPAAPFSVDGSLRYVLQPGQEQQVPITFAPTTASAEPYTTTVKFRNGAGSELSRTITAYADDPDVAAGADVRIAPTLVQFGYVPKDQYPWVERQITLYNYGDQAVSGKAILPAEESAPFRIQNGTGPWAYTLPAATVDGETVTPGAQTFTVQFAATRLVDPPDPQSYNRDILFTGWGGATCNVSASTLTGSATIVSGVRVNELVSWNTTGLQDEDAQCVDWIELYNENGDAVNLAGWTLHHTPTGGVESVWAFPTGAFIPANGYLIVHASGKDRPATLSTGFLHTNFTLNETVGGSLRLALPDAQTVSEITYPASPDKDLSYAVPGSFPIPAALLEQKDTGTGGCLSRKDTPLLANTGIFWNAFLGLYVQNKMDWWGVRSVLGWRPLSTWDLFRLEENVNYSKLENILATRGMGRSRRFGPSNDDAIRQGCYAPNWYTKRALLESLKEGADDIYVIMGHSYCDAMKMYPPSHSTSALHEDLLTYDDLVAEFPQGIPNQPKLVVIHSCNSGKTTGSGYPRQSFNPVTGITSFFRYPTQNTLAKFWQEHSDIYMGWDNTAHGDHIMEFDYIEPLAKPLFLT